MVLLSLLLQEHQGLNLNKILEQKSLEMFHENILYIFIF